MTIYWFILLSFCSDELFSIMSGHMKLVHDCLFEFWASIKFYVIQNTRFSGNYFPIHVCLWFCWFSWYISLGHSTGREWTLWCLKTTYFLRVIFPLIIETNGSFWACFTHIFNRCNNVIFPRWFALWNLFFFNFFSFVEVPESLRWG